jgi:hypothetical protein
MNNFFRLYAIYRSVTNWSIVKYVYKNSEVSWQAVMWISKLAAIALGVIGFLAPQWPPYFGGIVILAIIWMVSFSRAREAAFSDFYNSYRERIKFFRRDNQYIRYLMFRKQLGASPYVGSIEDLLVFVDKQINTDSHYSVMSHPFISAMLALLFAVVSGIAGKLPVALDVAVAMILSYVVYFSYAALSFSRTPQVALKEFKRFLLWVRDEESSGARIQ